MRQYMLPVLTTLVLQAHQAGAAPVDITYQLPEGAKVTSIEECRHQSEYNQVGIYYSGPNGQYVPDEGSWDAGQQSEKYRWYHYTIGSGREFDSSHGPVNFGIRTIYKFGSNWTGTDHATLEIAASDTLAFHFYRNPNDNTDDWNTVILVHVSPPLTAGAPYPPHANCHP